MLKGYWIIRVDVSEIEPFKEYMQAAAEVLKKYNARFLIRGGHYEVVEGFSRSRNSVVEFPNYDTAFACWNSMEYQSAIKIRQPVSTMDLVVIEGYDGPQPS